MKMLFIVLAAALLLALTGTSCSAFKPKYGCPATGKNVGAETLLSNPNAARKAKKFRA